MPPFAVDIRRWATISDFESHLAQCDPAIASWSIGLTLHHTWTPTIAQWRGIQTLFGTKDYYMYSVPNSNGTKGGWPSGPHLFICGDAPNPNHRGIFQLTPLDTPGTHAGRCNKDHWGCEVVGRYDDTFWSGETAELVLGATTALYRWRGLDPKTLNGHCLCLKNKTCPGNAIIKKLPEIRTEITQRLATTRLRTWRVKPSLPSWIPIHEARDEHAAVALSGSGLLPPGYAFRGEAVPQSGFVWIADGRGFLDVDYLEAA